MTAPTTGNPPAGWYTDPAGSGGQRWFDGAGWTSHVQAPPAPVAPAPVVPQPYLPQAPTPAYAAATPAYASATPAFAPLTTTGDPRFAPATQPEPMSAFGGDQSRFGSATPAATGWIQPVESHYLISPTGDLQDGKNTPARVAIWVSVLAMLGVPIAAVVGIVLAVVGLKRARTLESAGWAPKGRTLARWALALSIVGGVIGALLVANVVRTYLAEADAAVDTGVISTGTTFDTTPVETEIAAGILAQTGTAVTVQCPEQVVTGATTTFQCVAADAAGVPATVDVQVDAAGNWSWSVG